MKKLLLLLLVFPVVLHSQNVGIGNSAPSEKLDVTGNINVTGTIKANGVDGIANQVLMKNSSGTMVWGDINNYKNLATFRTAGSGSWDVPAGVTKVWVEVWGGGGGGNYYAGGGGGAYISGLINVTSPNTISYTVGGGGAGGFDNSTGGGASSINYSAGGITLTAGAGQGVTTTGTTTLTIGNGFGGDYSATPSTFLSFYGERGRNGQGYASSFTQAGATTYEIVQSGYGGDAGNSARTGGPSNTLIYNVTTSTTVRFTNALANPVQPGGGGGSGFRILTGSANLGGATGAAGTIIIHY